MMFDAFTGLDTISFSSAPLDTPSDDQPRVPTMTTASGSFARMTGMTCSAYDLICCHETPLGSLAIS